MTVSTCPVLFHAYCALLLPRCVSLSSELRVSLQLICSFVMEVSLFSFLKDLSEE